MQIQINTDRHIEGHEAMVAQVRGVVKSALSRHEDLITRVEVHLSDENSNKKGGNDDIRCMMEAQRDYFGAHTYERIDAKGTFHTEWGTE